MAEQIQPGGSVVSGYFTTSQVGPTGAEALADALRAGGKLTTAIDERVRDKELMKVEDLLSSPTITEQEVREIELNAKYPLARLKAENRRGTVIAEQGREDLEVRIRNAADAVEARQILRDAQEEFLSRADNDGVRAGIRQRMSEIAPRLLEDASARRLADREREDILNVDTDLRLRLDTDPGQFVDAYVGHAQDEKLSNGDMKAFHERGAATVFNYYREGVALGKPGSNPRTSDALEAIDSVLDGPFGMTGAERDQWITTRNRIVADEEAARKALAAGGGEIEKQIFMQAQNAVIAFRRANPYAPVPKALGDQLLSMAYSPESQRTAFELIKDDPNATGEKMRRGVADTETWQSVRSRLADSLSVSALEDAGVYAAAAQVKAETLREFDAAALAIPEEYASEPAKLMDIANRLAEQSQAKASAWKAGNEARVKQAQEESASLTEALNLAVSSGNTTAVAILSERRAAAQAEYVDRAFKAEMLRWLRMNNVDLERTHFVAP